MSAVTITAPFPLFTDIDGNPLEAGYIYIGETGLNPETNPLAVYWDAALTIPAAQPIRTIGGYASRNGAPGQLYASAVNYSMLVKNKNGSLVWSTLAGTGISPNADGVTFVQAGTGAVEQSVQDKLRNGVMVSVTDFEGVDSTGATESTAGLVAAIAAHDNLYWPPGTYLVDTLDNALEPTSKSKMHWLGYGATIKAKDGATASGNALMLRLLNCSNVVIEGLTFDGNRANRSAFASSSHCIQINDGDNITLRDVTVKNATYDGIYVRGTTPATESTYPTKILLDNVMVDNAYRNGLSLIGANGVTIRGGRFTNTNGTAPQAGIDIEPNPSDAYLVKNVLIDGTHFEGNTGTGITITGNVGVLSDNIKLMNITGKANAECFILAAYVSNLIIDGASVNADTTIPTQVGIITILNEAEEVNIRNVDFRDITGVTATKAAIYLEDAAPAPRYVSNIRASNISCQTIYARSSKTYIDGVQVDTCTGVEPTIYTAVGSYCSVKNVSVTNKTTSTPLRIASTFTDVVNVTIVDAPNGIRMQGANNKYRDITILNSGTAASYGCYMDTATGVVIENVNISDAGGYWTNSTAFNVSAVASLAGARFRDVYPSPLIGSATWDPPSIANGAQATTTVSVTRADIGDFVRAWHSITLGGLHSFAYVSAANTVTVGLSNTSGGAVDLASHTVNVEVIK